MRECYQETLPCRPEDLSQALSIHTRKVTDSCRDKDCIEDLRIYMTKESQATLDTATAAKVRTAELLYTAIDVTPVAFNRSHYCIDLTFYYRILADGVVGACRPAALSGLALFQKRAVLCGEQSGVHVFTSDGAAAPSGCPSAVVEVLDPIVLSSRLSPTAGQETLPLSLPPQVQNAFDDPLVCSGDRQRLFVTLGQFSIIRLERPAQLIVPVLDYAIPTKECRDDLGCAEDPCDVFARIPFPSESFAPTPCADANRPCPLE